MNNTILKLMLTTSLLALAGQVQAQTANAAQNTTTAADDKAEVSEVVVTGTRIVRPNNQSAAPVTSVTATEIEAAAAVNIEEILNRLPQVAPDSQQNYQDSDGRQRIKLRNLGFERTLVLVDGKRLGTMNGQDAGIIPTSMVQRIDVLSGGASSVYGSDAISGVVNFILKDDFEGLQLDANYSFYNHENKTTIVTPVAQASAFPTPIGTVNDGGRKDITLTYGKHLFDDALTLSGFVNYRDADLVPYSDRATSACQLTQSVVDGPLSCSISTYSPSGYLSPQGGSNSGSVYLNNPDGTRTFVPYGIGEGKAANPYDGYSYQRESERLNAGLFGTLKLNDSAEIYGNVIWFKDESYNRFPTRVYSYTAYGSTPYAVNCDNPLMSAAQATGICGTQAGTSTMMPLEVRYRFDELPYTLATYVNEGVRATGGVRGVFGNVWNYDIGGVYARNQMDSNGGAFADFAKVNRSLNVVNVNGTPTCVSKVDGTDPNCVPFDAFKAGNNDQALADYLFTGQNGTSTGVGTLYDLVATVSGDLAEYGVISPWAEQGVAVSAGLEYREEHWESTADAIYRLENGGSDVSLSQSVVEGNIEFQAPLIEERKYAHLLQVNGGYRLSRYDTNPETFNTWKIEGLYAPVQDITFRAAFNKAQRAPTVIEMSQASNISFTTQGGSQNDFCAGIARQIQDPNDPTKQITVIDAPTASREVCRATGLSDALYGSTSLSCPNSQCTVRTGGFTVDPETANTVTFGVVLRPTFLPGLTLSIDRFIIDLDDSINYNDYSYYQNGCLTSGGDAYFCDKIVRDPVTGTLYSSAASNPTTGFISQGTTNAYKSKSHGWDFQGQYGLELENFGKFDWVFNGSLSTRQSGQDSPLRPEINCIGYFGSCGGQFVPEWTHGLRTTYTIPNDRLSVSVNWRYVSSLTHTSNSGDPLLGWVEGGERKTFYNIPAYNYFDVSVAYKVTDDAKLRVSANNILDEEPPVIPNSYNVSLARNNTLPQRYDSLGRQISIGLTLNF
jgi:iron complex outermembrane receptor protein